ncbi:hypothetical protein N878_13370 [Pseudomonas sp. EGD-AK9]|nr:hypothetical protein N878_13370 [Pseudomonas sp. EGD-AK9]
MLAGSSSGTLVAAALRYCREQREAKRVLTFVCDSGNKYLSKMFNDYWMIDQGLIERPQAGNLRDLIARRYDEGATVTCKADESLAAVYARMRFHDIDQVPVMDGERVVGLIDEWDLLRAVKDAPEHFELPVRRAMVTQLQTLDPEVPLERLLETFDAGHVALIVERGRFLGLITKSDLLNLWRRTLR